MKTMNPADNYCCMVSFADKDNPKILEIQGVTWFATDDLAYQYYMFLKPELREDHVYPVDEENLPWHFDCGSDYIKDMKTKTRLTGLETGVLVGQGPEYEKAVNDEFHSDDNPFKSESVIDEGYSDEEEYEKTIDVNSPIGPPNPANLELK